MSSQETPALSFDLPFPWRTVTLYSVTILQASAQVLGLVGLVIVHGFDNLPAWLTWLLDPLFIILAVLLSLSLVVQWRISLAPRAFLRENRLAVIVVAVTVAGALLFGVLLSPAASTWLTGLPGPSAALHAWWQMTVFIWAGLGLQALFRQISFARWNPATILILSFLALIAFGTALLSLPRARAPAAEADLEVALFTSVSAVCVTGLTVVDTGTHWSFAGQVVLLILFQLGGLGIMTFGAFFALVLGRGLFTRQQSLMGNLLEHTVLNDVRRLLFAILVFTLVCEVGGAILLSGLWPELPRGQRIFYSIFHSVSAFCNAGFALMPDSFENHALHWQVWGVVSFLIVAGGLGFVVVYNLFELLHARWTKNTQSHSLLFQQREHVHFRLTSRLVLATTFVLLILGLLVIWGLESGRKFAGMSWSEQLALSWFQSVTCRTAGFNTISIGELSEATKFFMVFLMCIGASPGSTGGGLKTVTLAVLVLSLWTIARGRRQVELAYRTIPESQVSRALLMVGFGINLLVFMTLVVVWLENRPGYFLDYMFEVSSALGTVGLSTGVTRELSRPSRWVIMLAMFLGRIGPLTLLLALAGPPVPERYSYPEERVVLG